MRRLTGCVVAITVAGVVLPLGCTGLLPGLSSSISSTDILRDLLGSVQPNTVQLSVINQTTYDIQLDVLVDGVPQTLTASVGVPSRYVLQTCPTEVITVAERWLQDGRVVGGRTYPANSQYSFRAGSFSCGSVLTWVLSQNQVQTFVL